MTEAEKILNAAETSNVEPSVYLTQETVEGNVNRTYLDILNLLDGLTGTEWDIKTGKTIQEFPRTYEYRHASGVKAIVQLDNCDLELMPVTFTDGNRTVERKVMHFLWQKDMLNDGENKGITVAVELD